MILAELFTLNNNSKTIESHRHDLPAKYEKIFYTPKEVTRYVSDEPCVCVAEYIKSGIDSTVNTLFVQKVSEHTAEYWYAAAVISGLVVLDIYGPRDYVKGLIEYYISCCDIYVAGFEETPNCFKGATLRELVDFDDIPTEYHLEEVIKKTSNVPKYAIALFLVGLLGGAGAFYIGMKEPPPPPPKPFDPYGAWRTVNAGNIKAYAGLMKALRTTATLMSLPPDWQAGDITLNNGQLQADINPKKSIARISTLTAWKANNQGLEHYINKSNTVNVPLVSTAQQSLNRLNNYPDIFNDALVSLGADKVEKIKTMNLGVVDQYEYHITYAQTYVATLGLLADLVKQQPVFLKTLLVKLQPHGLVHINVVLVLEGV